MIVLSTLWRHQIDEQMSLSLEVTDITVQHVLYVCFSYGARRVIVREGQLPMCFYFVLSGSGIFHSGFLQQSWRIVMSVGCVCRLYWSFSSTWKAHPIVDSTWRNYSFTLSPCDGTCFVYISYPSPYCRIFSQYWILNDSGPQVSTQSSLALLQTR